MAPPRTSVFIVDDHELVAALRESLRLQPDLFVVGETDSAAEGLRRIPLVSPHVALLAVRLPDGDGIELCRAIRERAASVRCLMLSHESQEGVVTDAVLAGASGFIRKDVGVDELVDAVRRVANGESLISIDPTIEKLRIPSEGSGSPDHTLTATELRILDLVGEGLSNREIAAELVLAEQTVKNYVSRVLGKLGMKRRTEAALYAARRRGQA